MGNGFTFELESLLFYSVVRTIVPRDRLSDCGVYGDDIIVPQEYAVEVIKALNFLGFRVNGSKSFLAGSFFESCGADFFEGQNVRPFHLAGHEGDIPYALQIANQLRQWSHRQGGEEFCDSTFLPVWKWLIKQTHKDWRHLRVPPSFGDSGLISSWSEVAHLPRPKGGIEGKLVRYRILKLRTCVVRSYGVLLSDLARLQHGQLTRPWYSKPGPRLAPPRCPFSKGRQSLRGIFGKPVTKMAVVSNWPYGWEWM
jgi:hypothetical protein